MTGSHPLELNRAVPGGRVEMFAIKDDDLGRHHRHVSFGDDTEIEFQNITAHVARFLREVGDLSHRGHKS